MKKRLAAVLLALCLAVSPAAVWAGDPETDKLIRASESIAEEILLSDGKTADALIEQVLPEGMTREEAAEYLAIAAEVVTSEEFQELLSHVEVQELLKEVIRDASVLVKEEPEMVKEILRTLGIKEGVIDIFVLAYDHMDVLVLLAKDYLETEEGEQLISALSELKDKVDYQELAKGLSMLLDTDSSSFPESVAESPESAAEMPADRELGGPG